MAMVLKFVTWGKGPQRRAHMNPSPSPMRWQTCARREGEGVQYLASDRAKRNFFVMREAEWLLLPDDRSSALMQLIVEQEHGFICAIPEHIDCKPRKRRARCSWSVWSNKRCARYDKRCQLSLPGMSVNKRARGPYMPPHP
ncbi:hypothetical protein TRVL_05339 [Trypanosoma vivax]|nr:hypothetical protein TRVL_05339 [Trypanosoma vivax]